MIKTPLGCLIVGLKLKHCQHRAGLIIPSACVRRGQIPGMMAQHIPTFSTWRCTYLYRNYLFHTTSLHMAESMVLQSTNKVSAKHGPQAVVQRQQQPWYQWYRSIKSLHVFVFCFLFDPILFYCYLLHCLIFNLQARAGRGAATRPVKHTL